MDTHEQIASKLPGARIVMMRASAPPRSSRNTNCVELTGMARALRAHAAERGETLDLKQLVLSGQINPDQIILPK